MDDAVVFQGDRLEPSYEWVPGQWGGLLGGVFIQGGAQSTIPTTSLLKIHQLHCGLIVLGEAFQSYCKQHHYNPQLEWAVQRIR